VVSQLTPTNLNQPQKINHHRPVDTPGRRETRPVANGDSALLVSNYGNSRRSVFSPSRTDQLAKREEAQVKRFYLQSIARELIQNATPQHGKISKRTCGCLRRRVSKEKPVQMLHVAATMSAHYGNLQSCSNVWLCAVCSAKISERRRQELTDAFERHPELCKVMATFTVRHHLHERLSSLERDLEASLAWMRKHRRYGALMKRLGNKGHIRGLEPLHNTENGWHPHYHEVLLFDHELTADELAELEVGLKELWLKALRRFDRDGTWANGCHIVMGDQHVKEYLDKFDKLPRWTMAHELTKSQVKKSATHGRTPNELLMLYADGDEQAGELWLEFAAAFRGKHQLQWSRGLKALLGVADKTDEEIALEQQQQATLLAELDALAWKIVIANDCRAELLNLAGTGDSDKVWSYLADLGIQRPASPGCDDDEDDAEEGQPCPNGESFVNENVTSQPCKSQQELQEAPTPLPVAESPVHATASEPPTSVPSSRPAVTIPPTAHPVDDSVTTVTAHPGKCDNADRQSVTAAALGPITLGDSPALPHQLAFAGEFSDLPVKRQFSYA
jgi:hypothetical protein